MGPITTGRELKVSETTVRKLPKRKTQKKPKRSPKLAAAAKIEEVEKTRPAVGTLTRTKSLLLAALRVWELKQGIRE